MLLNKNVWNVKKVQKLRHLWWTEERRKLGMHRPRYGLWEFECLTKSDTNPHHQTSLWFVSYIFVVSVGNWFPVSKKLSGSPFKQGVTFKGFSIYKLKRKNSLSKITGLFVQSWPHNRQLQYKVISSINNSNSVTNSNTITENFSSDQYFIIHSVYHSDIFNKYSRDEKLSLAINSTAAANCGITQLSKESD